MASQPTLHDIAAMPFPASRDAMRKYYDPSWAMPVAEDGDGRPKQKWRVEVNYTVLQEATEWVTVEAADEDEAIDLAEDMVAEQATGEDFDVIHSRAEALSGTEAHHG